MDKIIICVAGKNNIAVDVLQYLKNNSNERYDLCVSCNKTEKGINSFQKSLRFYAEQNNIPEKKLEDLYDLENLIFLSMEYDSIIDPGKFKSKKLYNIHFSLLPKYKGMYTSALPILNGEEKTGVTLHRIDRGIDTGEIIAQTEFCINKNDTCRDLYLKYIKYGTILVLKNIENIISNNIESICQPGKNSTYYSKKAINYSELKVDLNCTAYEIQNQIRAYSFREYQMPEINNKKVISSRITDIKSVKKPGTIIMETESFMMLSTIDYNIIIYIDRFDDLLKACEKGDICKAKEICSVQEHVNAKDEHGWSPLIVATYNNQIDIVLFLISIGADIYVKNNNGTNLLMYSKNCFVKYNDNTVFKLFHNLGLSEYDEDYNNKNLLYYLNEDKLSVSDLI